MATESQTGQFMLTQAMQLLRATPGALKALLADLSDEWVDFQEETDAWSPRQVLIHLIHTERINWIPRAKVSLSEGGPHPFPPYVQMPEGYLEDPRTMQELLSEFDEQRGASLEELQGFNLAPNDLERPGLHPELGEVQLRHVLSTWVVHDMNHVHQIAKALAKRYTEEVAEFRRYLAILEI